jgi:hypothetical protein
MNTKDMPLQNGDGGTWYASAGDRRGSTDLVAAQADQGAVGRVRPWWWVGEA